MLLKFEARSQVEAENYASLVLRCIVEDFKAHAASLKINIAGAIRFC